MKGIPRYHLTNVLLEQRTSRETRMRLCILVLKFHTGNLWFWGRNDDEQKDRKIDSFWCFHRLTSSRHVGGIRLRRRMWRQRRNQFKSRYRRLHLCRTSSVGGSRTFGNIVIMGMPIWNLEPVLLAIGLSAFSCVHWTGMEFFFGGVENWKWRRRKLDMIQDKMRVDLREKWKDENNEIWGDIMVVLWR